MSQHNFISPHLQPADCDAFCALHAGKAIAEYWGVGDDTVVFVADPSFGDILNFNVGQNIDLEVPRRFWCVCDK